MGITLRRKWWIILPTLGLSIVAALLTRGIPDLYRAETLILVDLQQVPGKYVPEETMAANIGDRLRTLEQQILSPTRVRQLVESEHLYPDPTGKKTEEQLAPNWVRSRSLTGRREATRSPAWRAMSHKCSSRRTQE